MDVDVIANTNHFYEQQQCGGTLMYIIDGCEPSYIKFTARITLKVILDNNANSSSSSKSLTGSERHGSFELDDNAQFGNGDEVNSAAKKSTKIPHNNVDMQHTDEEALDSVHSNSNDDLLRDDENGGRERSDLNQESSAPKRSLRCKERKERNAKKSCCDGGKVGVDVHRKEDSLAVHVSKRRASKDIKGSLPTKKGKTGPKGRGKRKGDDVHNVKTKKIINKRRNIQVGNKCEQEIINVKVENDIEPSEEDINFPEVEMESEGMHKKQTLKRLIPQNVRCVYCDTTFPNKLAFYDHRRNQGPGFECKICHKVEPFEAHLICHMQTHEPDRGYANFDGVKKDSDGKRVRPKRKCNVCGFVSSYGALCAHMMHHTKESPYRCCVCKDQAFPTLPMLHFHLESHKRIRCKICKGQFASRSELIDHQQSEHQDANGIKCDLCDELFPNKTSRAFHYRDSHPREVKKCSECSKSFTTEEKLQMHILYHVKCKKEVDNGKGKKQTLKRLIPQNVRCVYCDTTFPNKLAFYDHRRNQGPGFECKICHKVEPFEAHLICHMQTHEPDRGYADFDGVKKDSDGKRVRPKRKCNVCGVVSSYSALCSHMMLHTKESPYRCCVCNEQAFSTLPTLHAHLESHNKQSKGFPCKECKVEFASRLELSDHKSTHEIKCDLCGIILPSRTSINCHYRTSHANEVKKCSECSSIFPSDEELRKHMLLHRRQLKGQCPVCGIVVKRLNNHMTRNHSATAGDKSFACDQCPMRYKNKANLVIHLRIHTGERPYACHLCPKNYRSSLMLRKHLLSHSSERLFACSLCDKKFFYRSNVETHMKVHSKQAKYSCSRCVQVFNDKLELEIHVETKHGISYADDQDIPSYAALNQHPVQNSSMTMHPTINVDRAILYGTVGNFSSQLL